MNGTFEPIFGYMHCVGRTHYHAGYADSQDEARRWVAQQAGATALKEKAPETDPVRRCPVRQCHMKRQYPWFGFRSPDGAITIRRTFARKTHSPPDNASETAGILEAVSRLDQEHDGTQGKKKTGKGGAQTADSGCGPTPPV